MGVAAPSRFRATDQLRSAPEITVAARNAQLNSGTLASPGGGMCTHTGVATFPKDDPAFRRESCQGGWEYFFGRLKEFLEHEPS
jgi:hypothetical protein